VVGRYGGDAYSRVFLAYLLHPASGPSLRNSLKLKPSQNLRLPSGYSWLGCPLNNQFFFRFEPKQTETQSVSVVFRFVSRNPKKFYSICFGPVSKQPKQTEKTSKQRSLLGYPQNN
jgi:hypothetical protein